MNLPKPLKIALLLLGTYVVSVLVFRFGRNGTEWDRALLISLVVAPVALLWAGIRDRINKKAETAGRRWRAKRQT
jgi:hypothetical protein